ncbi:MAG: signal recognition particle [Candidatus Thermoplasmatota archaeon]|nr:signal recognition particle [Candidatus Thermoplasmatota archaeon]MCL5731136.1 signal recognition particle [Candidatus Thermoplasmatota archaeon]
MKIILFPEYFDPKITRKMGRRIKKVSIKTYDPEVLRQIFRDMNIRFTERSARYPRTPWKQSSIFEIDADVGKSTVIKMVERKLEQL